MYRILVVKIVILFILTGCGGGGSSTENGNGGTQNIKPTSVSRPTPTAGDFVTYLRTAETRIGSSPSYIYFPYVEFTNNRIVFVNADSSYKQTETSHSYYLSPNSLSERIQNTKAQAFFSSDHGLSAFYNFQDQSECRYTPPFRTEPNLLAVGLIWSIDTKASCSDDGIPNSFTTTYQGKVLGLETITVPAGTFNTLKYEITLKSANIESNPSAILNCWKDTVTGLDVRCDRPPNANFPRVSRNELVGYSIAGLGKKNPPIASYAGDWTGQYSGNDQGNCKLKINTSGVINGSCNGLKAGIFSISGSVKEDAKITFNLKMGNETSATFTGQFPSPQTLLGTWFNNNGFSGEWAFEHD